MREVLAQLVDRARGSSKESRFSGKREIKTSTSMPINTRTSDNNKIAGNLLRLPARYWFRGPAWVGQVSSLVHLHSDASH